MKPGERRLLSYAADVGVLMDARADTTPGRLLRVRARDGIVIQETEERSAWTYSARSEEARRVTLVVEHRRRQGWTLASGQTPTESTPDAHRFRLVVEPGREGTLTVREARTSQLHVSVGDFNEIHLSHLGAAGASSAALQRALAPVLARRTELPSSKNR